MIALRILAQRASEVPWGVVALAGVLVLSGLWDLTETVMVSPAGIEVRKLFGLRTSWMPIEHFEYLERAERGRYHRLVFVDKDGGRLCVGRSVGRTEEIVDAVEEAGRCHGLNLVLH